MNRRQKETFILNVEGEVCEKLYFEHLRDLINQEEKRKKECVLIIKVKESPVNVVRNNSQIRNQFFHIQDVEDYSEDQQKEKFHKLINDVVQANQQAKSNKSPGYKLGYTNFSFDLWICLHKGDMNFSVQHRKKYITYINRYYNTSYQFIDEYKNQSEFSKILSNIRLEDVKNAIRRGKMIRNNNDTNNSVSANQKKIQYRTYTFYSENPDLDLFEVVEIIMNKCL